MAAITCIFSSIKTRCLTCTNKPILNLFNQQRNYAKRQGVKAMKEAKLRKAAQGADEKTTTKKSILAKSSTTKTLQVLSKLDKTIRVDEPVDNVYCFLNYKFRSYSVEEAIKMHSESHHSTMYNEPNALVNAFFELDMSLKNRKNKCLDSFISKIYYPHELVSSQPFKVLAICKRPEEQKAAEEAGAYIVGNMDYIKMIKKGEVPHDNFDYVVTTPDLLPEFVPIRGILNKKFPHQTKGTVGFDVGTIVKKLSHAMEYRVISNPPEPQYAWVNVPVGRLQMSVDKIEENLKVLVEDVSRHKAANQGAPIIRLLFLICPPTEEKFLIPHEKYLPVQEEDSDDEAVVKKQ